MAFGLQYLQRVNSTVDLNKISNPTEGQVTGQGPTMWLYNATSVGANDSAATVEGSAYFNGATGYLSKGDLVYVTTNDPGYHLLAVTSTSQATPVTTSALV